MGGGGGSCGSTAGSAAGSAVGSVAAARRRRQLCFSMVAEVAAQRQRRQWQQQHGRSAAAALFVREAGRSLKYEHNVWIVLYQILRSFLPRPHTDRFPDDVPVKVTGEQES